MTINLNVLHQDAADAAKSAMVSVIGLDSDKVQQLCDAANAEVDKANKVQIANYLCPVRFFSCPCDLFNWYSGCSYSTMFPSRCSSNRGTMQSLEESRE